MSRVYMDASEMTRIFDELVSKAKTVPMAAIAIPYVNGVEHEIQTEGRGTWPAFAEATLRMHPRRRGGKLLQDTGALASIQVDVENSVGLATVYSPAEYAWKHANGYKSKRENIPQRDFFNIDMEKASEEASIIAVTEILG